MVFCEDYEKIVYSLKHSLTLVRKTDDDSIFGAAADGAGKVSLNKITWFMPHVITTEIVEGCWFGSETLRKIIFL